jgi:uncharacterized protein
VDQSVAKFLNLPGLLALARPRATAALAILLSAIGIVALNFIQFDSDIVRAITSESKISREYLQFSESVEEGSSDIVILAQAETGFTADAIGALRDLALDIELSGPVLAVLSPFSSRFPRNHPEYPGESVIPFDPDQSEVRIRLAEFRKQPGIGQPLITDDLRNALIIVVVNKKRQPKAESLADIRAFAGGYEIADVQLTITGETAISAEIVDRLRRDLLVLNIVGGLIGIAIAAMIFRKPAAIVVATGPALSGALAALSMFVVTGYPVTVLSNVVPILAYVLALADSAHLTGHLTSLDRSRARMDRLRETVLSIGPACGLTAATTAVAFAAISFSNNEPLREFAIVGALATVGSYCAVMIWFVTLALVLDPRIPGKQRGLPLPPLPAVIKDWAFRKTRTTIFLGAIAMALAATGYATTTPWFTLYDNLPETSPVRRAAELAETQFGGFFRLWVEYGTEGPNGWNDQQGWTALARKTSALEAFSPETTVVAPSAISRWLGDEGSPPLPDDLEEIANPLTTAILPPGGQRARVLILTGDPMRSADSLRNYDALEEAAHASGASLVTGLPVLMRHEPVDLVRQLSIGLVAACLICIAIIAAAFRSLRLIPALLLPNLLPLAVTASSLHWLRDGHLTPTGMLALTIAFGVAVDDSIHLVNRHFLEIRAGRDRNAALLVAIDETGKVMIATTLLICGGLVVTFFSEFSNIRLFGTMLILTFAVALAADLILLPALMRLRWFR